MQQLLSKIPDFDLDISESHKHVLVGDYVVQNIDAVDLESVLECIQKSSLHSDPRVRNIAARMIKALLEKGISCDLLIEQCRLFIRGLDDDPCFLKETLIEVAIELVQLGIDFEINLQKLASGNSMLLTELVAKLAVLLNVEFHEFHDEFLVIFMFKHSLKLDNAISTKLASKLVKFLDCSDKLIKFKAFQCLCDCKMNQIPVEISDLSNDDEFCIAAKLIFMQDFTNLDLDELYINALILYLDHFTLSKQLMIEFFEKAIDLITQGSTMAYYASRLLAALSKHSVYSEKFIECFKISHSSTVFAKLLETSVNCQEMIDLKELLRVASLSSVDHLIIFLNSLLLFKNNEEILTKFAQDYLNSEQVVVRKLANDLLKMNFNGDLVSVTHDCINRFHLEQEQIVQKTILASICTFLDKITEIPRDLTVRLNQLMDYKNDSNLSDLISRIDSHLSKIPIPDPLKQLAIDFSLFKIQSGCISCYDC